MFFLIGGVQPKTVTLDEVPGICAACGLAQARLKRVDHYLSLFFIPLFAVKKGDPVLICDRVGLFRIRKEICVGPLRKLAETCAPSAATPWLAIFAIALHAEREYKEFERIR